MPDGFAYDVVRVIHAMPDDVVDGWKVVIHHDQLPAIEVIHRNLAMAKSVALSAAAELFPDYFKGWDSDNGRKRYGSR